MKIGIIGAGKIANKMAGLLRNKPRGCECYAVASRSLEKAQAFAQRNGMPVAYGSYEELVSDPNVDLVYVATPHSHHYEHARLAIEHHKPCLVEKAFTANARQAEELLNLAEANGVFITEAVMTRYMPIYHQLKELLDSGIIGEPQVLTAGLCFTAGDVERILRPELCGGALLDLGVYCLNFASACFGSDIVKTVTSCQVGPTGVDMHETISLTYADGRMANLQSGVICQNNQIGLIGGTEGYIRLNKINIPQLIEVYRNNELVATYPETPDATTGYEYEVFECQRCLEEGLLESPLKPHKETLSIMQQMDALRAEWDVKFPMDDD